MDGACNISQGEHFLNSSPIPNSALQMTLALPCPLTHTSNVCATREHVNVRQEVHGCTHKHTTC